MLFWIILIIGVAICLLFHWLERSDNISSKNTSTDKKETLESMIASLEQSIPANKQQTTSNQPTLPDDNIMANAHAFVSLCQKLDSLGKPGYGIYILKDELSNGLTEFYIEHTFHDVDHLVFAHDSMRKGDSRMVKHYYDSIVSTAQLTDKERGFFLTDYSDFCDFLNGGIEKYNTLKRNSLYDISIKQYLGVCASRAIAADTYIALRNEINMNK